MKNFKIMAIAAILLTLLSASCINESDDFSQFIDKSFYVKQGSGQCGPTSFYMIFRFYGDNRVDDEFWELPDCSTPIPLQEELKTVTSDSGVSTWLGVTDKGITIDKLHGKICNLTLDRINPYYQVQCNTTTGLEANMIQFSYINRNFLQRGIPVIIHLRREEVIGIPVFSGHYMVIVGYSRHKRTVYYVDPNKNADDPVIQRVSLAGFLNTKWYRSPDYSLMNPVPDAYWDGTWIAFERGNDQSLAFLSSSR